MQIFEADAYCMRCRANGIIVTTGFDHSRGIIVTTGFDQNGTGFDQNGCYSCLVLGLVLSQSVLRQSHGRFSRRTHTACGAARTASSSSFPSTAWRSPSSSTRCHPTSFSPCQSLSPSVSHYLCLSLALFFSRPLTPPLSHPVTLASCTKFHPLLAANSGQQSDFSNDTAFDNSQTPRWVMP